MEREKVSSVMIRSTWTLKQANSRLMWTPAGFEGIGGSVSAIGPGESLNLRKPSSISEKKMDSEKNEIFWWFWPLNRSDESSLFYTFHFYLTWLDDMWSKFGDVTFYICHDRHHTRWHLHRGARIGSKPKPCLIMSKWIPFRRWFHFKDLSAPKI